MTRVHKAAPDVYHPDPSAPVPWIVRDARGYAVVGPPCDRCGACECVPCECHGEPIHERGCVGLSYAFVRLDHWTALCEACARVEGIEVVACTCPAYIPVDTASAENVGCAHFDEPHRPRQRFPA